MIKKVENTVPWIYVVSAFNGEEIVGRFCEKIEKVIKKDDKVYVKWKCYDNYFISWIDKKDIL